LRVSAFVGARFVAIFAAAAILSAGVAACGGDDEDTTDATISATTKRYCEIATEELAAAAQEVARRLRRNPELLEKDYAAGERILLRENRELYEEIERVVPDEIRDEVALNIADARARAGLTNAVYDAAAVEDARKAIAAYEQFACSSAGNR
jgi:hypothetical protein